jgi:predicted transcriptional regulator
MTRPNRVGKLELLVLEHLWQHGEASVVQVHRDVAKRRRIAPTTVSTILRRLEDKGLVAHRAEDRRFLFRPLVERRDLRRSMVGDLVDQLFGGSTSELLSHLVDEGKIDPAALERLRKVIAARKGEKGRRRGS